MHFCLKSTLIESIYNLATLYIDIHCSNHQNQLQHKTQSTLYINKAHWWHRYNEKFKVLLMANIIYNTIKIGYTCLETSNIMNYSLWLLFTQLSKRPEAEYQKDRIKTEGAYSIWKQVDGQTNGRLGIGETPLNMSAAEPKTCSNKSITDRKINGVDGHSVWLIVELLEPFLTLCQIAHEQNSKHVHLCDIENLVQDCIIYPLLTHWKCSLALNHRYDLKQYTFRHRSDEKATHFLFGLTKMALV